MLREKDFCYQLGEARSPYRPLSLRGGCNSSTEIICSIGNAIHTELAPPLRDGRHHRTVALKRTDQVSSCILKSRIQLKRKLAILWNWVFDQFHGAVCSLTDLDPAKPIVIVWFGIVFTVVATA